MVSHILLKELIGFILNQALGNIHNQLGQNEKAQELFRKASKINPRDPQVKAVFALLFCYLFSLFDGFLQLVLWLLFATTRLRLKTLPQYLLKTLMV